MDHTSPARRAEAPPFQAVVELALTEPDHGLTVRGRRPGLRQWSRIGDRPGAQGPARSGRQLLDRLHAALVA